MLIRYRNALKLNALEDVGYDSRRCKYFGIKIPKSFQRVEEVWAETADKKYFLFIVEERVTSYSSVVEKLDGKGA